MFYFTEDTQGATKYSNTPNNILKILRDCLSDGFGRMVANGRNGQQLYFNTGYLTNDHILYLIKDSAGNEIKSFVKKINQNIVEVIEDIENLSGDISIEVPPVGLALEETETELKFLLYGGFKYIVNKSNLFTALENIEGERIAFNFPFQSFPNMGWSIAADDKAIIIKTPRGNQENNVNIVSYSDFGYFFSYNRNGTPLGSSILRRTGKPITVNKLLLTVGDALGSISDPYKEGLLFSKVVYSAREDTALYVSPHHAILKAAGGLLSQNVGPDYFLYSGNKKVVIFTAYTNNFVPVEL